MSLESASNIVSLMKQGIIYGEDRFFLMMSNWRYAYGSPKEREEMVVPRKSLEAECKITPTIPNLKNLGREGSLNKYWRCLDLERLRMTGFHSEDGIDECNVCSRDPTDTKKSRNLFFALYIYTHIYASDLENGFKKHASLPTLDTTGHNVSMRPSSSTSVPHLIEKQNREPRRGLVKDSEKRKQPHLRSLSWAWLCYMKACTLPKSWPFSPGSLPHHTFLNQLRKIMDAGGGRAIGRFTAAMR
jgi:hypothetical protein